MVKSKTSICMTMALPIIYMGKYLFDQCRMHHLTLLQAGKR